MEELIVRQQVENLPVQNVGDFFTIGEILAQCGMLGISNPAEGFIVATTCHQQRMSFLEFGETYNVIQGNLSMKADAMLARLLELGGEYEIVSRTPEKAEIKASYGKAKGNFSFSWDEAKAEPFVYTKGSTTEYKKNWATPRARCQMLWARVVSEAVRTVCPLANKGAYTPEEVRDFDDKPKTTTTVETVVDPATVTVPEPEPVEVKAIEVEPEPDTTTQDAKPEDWQPPNLSVTAKPEEKAAMQELKAEVETPAEPQAEAEPTPEPEPAEDENPFTEAEIDPDICPIGAQQGIEGKHWSELDKAVLEYGVKNWQQLCDANPGKLTDAHKDAMAEALKAK